MGPNASQNSWLKSRPTSTLGIPHANSERVVNLVGLVTCDVHIQGTSLLGDEKVYLRLILIFSCRNLFQAGLGKRINMIMQTVFFKLSGDVSETALNICEKHW